VDVWTYFHQRESECDDLSLTPIGGFWNMVAAEEGSNDKRGRIFGAFALMDEINLHVSEVVVVQNDHVHREEYGYYLVNKGIEMWGFERDLSHEPAVHRHVGSEHQHEDAAAISFRAVVELAWAEVTRIHGKADF
jgi:hypothetical protein